MGALRLGAGWWRAGAQPSCAARISAAARPGVEARAAGGRAGLAQARVAVQAGAGAAGPPAGVRMGSSGRARGGAARAVCHAAALALLAGAAACAPPAAPARASGPIGQGAFVWQRRWTPAVQAAVAEHGPTFDQISVLVAEIEKDGRLVGTDALGPVGLPLLAGQRGVELAVRAAALPRGPAEEAALARLLTEGLRTAELGGVPVSALHLDIDVPTADLDEYAALVGRLGAAVAPVPLEVLALPSWVDAPGQAALSAAADRLVLQVHGLEPQPNGPPLLFDPGRAAAAVEALGAQGLPFRVALPTHAYPQPGVRAEPAEIAPLVVAWAQDRPAALDGLRWFRLPVAGDPDTWTAAALDRVRAGLIPTQRLGVEVRAGAGPGLFVLRLESQGEDAAPLPPLRVEAGGAGLDRPLPVDLGADYAEDPGGGGDALRLRPRGAAWLAPGAALELVLVAPPGPDGVVVPPTAVLERPAEAAGWADPVTDQVTDPGAGPGAGARQ